MRRWFIPRVPLTNNERERLHHMALHHDTKAWKVAVVVICKRPEIVVDFPVRLKLTVTRPRRQDHVDNRAASVKPILDALKYAGWIRDDSERWLECPPPEEVGTRDRARHGVLVEWEPKE